MKIGIDIDDVIVRSMDNVLKLFNKKYDKNIQHEEIYSYNLTKSLRVSEDEKLELWKGCNVLEDEEPLFIEGAVESVNKLIQEHEVCFITARPLVIQKRTKEFMKRIFPNNEIKIIHSSDKKDICHELNIDLLIEDLSLIVEQFIGTNKRVILFDKPWNKTFDDSGYDNIIRLNNWTEILGKIEEMVNH